MTEPVTEIERAEAHAVVTLTMTITYPDGRKEVIVVPATLRPKDQMVACG